MKHTGLLSRGVMGSSPSAPTNFKMKYKIETDDRTEFNLYYKGPEFHSALYDIVCELRNKVKYTNERGSWDKAYELILDILANANVNVYDE